MHLRPDDVHHTILKACLLLLSYYLRSFSQNTSSYYTIDAHGNVVQSLGSYESYKTWKDSFSKDDEVEHFTPKLSYPDPITVTGIGYGSGGYYPIQLKGADGNSYFTIVDKNGIQQFEPIKYPGLTFYAFTGDTTVQQKLDERFVDGVFVYSEDGEWYVVFPDGTKKAFPD